MRTFYVQHIVFNISHRLRPRALELPPWWSSIVPPVTALPRQTRSTNLCTLLSPSIALPKPIERRPNPFRTPYNIGLDQLLPLSCFPLSMAPIRPSFAQSLKRGDIREPVQCVEFSVILTAPRCTSSSFPSRRRRERRNQIFSTTRKVGASHRDPGFRGRQHRRKIGRAIGVP